MGETSNFSGSCADGKSRGQSCRRAESSPAPSPRGTGRAWRKAVLEMEVTPQLHPGGWVRVKEGTFQQKKNVSLAKMLNHTACAGESHWDVLSRAEGTGGQGWEGASGPVWRGRAVSQGAWTDWFLWTHWGSLKEDKANSNCGALWRRALRRGTHKVGEQCSGLCSSSWEKVRPWTQAGVMGPEKMGWLENIN